MSERSSLPTISTLQGGHTLGLRGTAEYGGRWFAHADFTGDNNPVERIFQAQHRQLRPRIAGLRVADEHNAQSHGSQSRQQFQRARVEAQHTGAGLSKRPSQRPGHIHPAFPNGSVPLKRSLRGGLGIAAYHVIALSEPRQYGVGPAGKIGQCRIPTTHQSGEHRQQIRFGVCAMSGKGRRANRLGQRFEPGPQRSIVRIRHPVFRQSGAQRAPCRGRLLIGANVHQSAVEVEENRVIRQAPPAWAIGSMTSGDPSFIDHVQYAVRQPPPAGASFIFTHDCAAR